MAIDEITGKPVNLMLQPNDEPLPLTMTLGEAWASIDITRGVYVDFQFDQAAYVIPQFTDTDPTVDPASYNGSVTHRLETFNCKYLHYKAVGSTGDGTGTLFRFQTIDSTHEVTNATE